MKINRTVRNSLKPARDASNALGHAAIRFAAIMESPGGALE
jgi:hypothetical protein